MTVEIDESMFVKRKHEVGRMVHEQWVFGGICRETRECFLYAVPDRRAVTLMPIIRQSIRPGTQIISDCWRAYRALDHDNSYTHLAVNHKENFVDPRTGANTQLAECNWNVAKAGNRARWGTHRQMLDSYLCEFMWRRRLPDLNPFDEILFDIALYWPPQ